MASRFITVVLMLVGLFVTTQLESIKAVWEFIFQCGAGLGLVLILRWYWWRINVWSEIVATIVPFIAYAILLQTDVAFPESFLITVACTTIAWLIITFITPPTEANHLVRFYEKVQPDGWWGNFSQKKMKPVEFAETIY